MTDEEPKPPQSGAPDEDDAPPSTPFDSPWFIPILLWGGAIWFGYDGWFNAEMEWVKFNRYGFAVLVALAVWFTWKAVRERRDETGLGDSSSRPPG